MSVEKTGGRVAKNKPAKPRAHSSQRFRTIEELAREQRVKPCTNPEALFGTWPGEDNDGFEALIDEIRHPERAAKKKQ